MLYKINQTFSLTVSPLIPLSFAKRLSTQCFAAATQLEVGLHNLVLRLFYLDLLTTSLICRYGALNANAEYEQLAMSYDSLVSQGSPNRTESDLCMRDIVTLDTSRCKLSLSCLDLLTSEAPAYGYQRTHQ